MVILVYQRVSYASLVAIISSGKTYGKNHGKPGMKTWEAWDETKRSNRISGNMIGPSIKYFKLVGGFNPSEKYESQVG